MSDLDLTAAAEWLFHQVHGDDFPWTEADREYYTDQVALVAPLIAAQVREQIAQEIDLPAVMNRLMYGSADDLVMADRINRAVGASRVRRTARGMSW